MTYDAHEDRANHCWYVSGPGIGYWRCPAQDLARAVAALMNRCPDYAVELVKRWQQQ